MIELEKVQEMLGQKLGEIRTPVLLIQSHKDLTVETVTRITARLTKTDYESIWHKDLDHSMVMDKQRQLVFDEINQYIHIITI